MSNTHSNPTDDAAPQDDRHIDPESASGEEVLGATSADAPANTTEKDPSEWVTGDEPMTGAQRSYLDTLARDAGETLRADLTKAEASEEIDRLQSSSSTREGTGAGGAGTPPA